MFGSNSNDNSDLPAAHADHYQNPNYTYLNFPSHLLDDNDLFLGTILPYPSPPPPPPLEQPIVEEVAEEITMGRENSEEQRPREEKGKRKRDAGDQAKAKRRTGKKDRHSKIYTANGPRDRRMRLSVQIARRFFDLQDMLGFDKASKTIDWLFSKSRAAIRDVAQGSCTSIILPPSPKGNDVGGEKNDDSKKKKKEKKMMMREDRKKARESARERARERTKEKQMMMMMQKQEEEKSSVDALGKGKEAHALEAEQSPSCSMIRAPNDSMIFGDYGLNHHHQSLEEQMASVGIIEKFLATSSTLPLCNIDDNDNHIGSTDGLPSYHQVIMRLDEARSSGFPGNWVTENARISGGFEGVLSNSNNPNCEFMGRPYN